MKKIILIILLVVVILGGAFAYIYLTDTFELKTYIQGFLSPKKDVSESTEITNTDTTPDVVEEEEPKVDCSTIKTTNWKSYSDSWKIKYPKEWKATKVAGGAAATQWFATFGTGGKTYVSVGGTARSYSQYLTDLRKTHTITKESPTTISGRTGTKIATTEKATGTAWDYYYVTYFNIARIFKGPHTGENCEPEIYQKMLKTYEYPPFM